MDKKELICINCPKGCNLSVTIDSGKIIVCGNECINGEKYAINEMTNPLRIVTSIIKTDNNNYVSCKTDRLVPKNKVFEIINEIKRTVVKEPVKINDILIKNVCGLDANIVSTNNL